MSILLLLDSRLRVAGGLDDFVIDVAGSVLNVRSLSLVYADITSPGAWTHPAFIVEIDGVPPGVVYPRGGSGGNALQGYGSFVVPLTPAPNTNAIFHEEAHFKQAVGLNPPASFARIRVRILGSDGLIAGLTQESLLIVRVD
jgi:hypothetical protein